MKKLLFSLFFIWILTVPALADYTVDAVSVTAEVNARGQAQVTSTFQLTFSDITEQVSLPLPETAVRDVSAGDYRFSTETTDEGVNVIVKRRGGFSGVQTFLITYSVPYSGNEVYTVGLLSSRWGRNIGNCSFQVLMPKPLEELPEPPEVISGYHGALSESDASLVTTETSLGGSVSDLMAFDSLRVEMTLPEEYFQVRQMVRPVVSLSYLAAGMFLVLVLCMIYWRAKLRSAPALPTTRVLLPEGILACQLPMTLDGYSCDVAAMILEWANLGYLTISQTAKGNLVLTAQMAMGSERGKAEQEFFSRIFSRSRRAVLAPGRYSAAAARFRAASRKSLQRVIFDRRSGNPVFVQLPCRILLAVGIGTLSYQILPEGAGYVILAVIFGVAGLIYAMYLHSLTQTFAALGHLTLYTVICWLILAALLVVSLLAGALPEMLLGALAVLFSAVFTAPGPRRSLRGTDARSQTLGLRNFYRNVSWQRLQINQGRSGRFFQTHLPRTVALGVTGRFASRFERLGIPQPEWLLLLPPPDRSAASLWKQLRPVVKQLRDAFR